MGITQEELAWRASMHRTYIADIERGARNVTLRSVTNLAEALQLTVGELFTYANLPAGSAAGVAADAATAQTEEIVLIEDNAADATMCVRAFRQARVTNPVKVLRDAEEGLEYLLGAKRSAKRKSGQPQLILLDLNLPGMSGVEFLRRIKGDARTRDVPVVILTVSRSDRTIVECGRLGAENYIVKPVEIENLLRITPKLKLHLTLGSSSGGRSKAESM